MGRSQVPAAYDKEYYIRGREKSQQWAGVFALAPVFATARLPIEVAVRLLARGASLWIRPAPDFAGGATAAIGFDSLSNGGQVG